MTLINPKLKHILEFGVFRGGTIRQLRGYFDETFQVIGFDSFIGLPEQWTDKDGKCVAGKGHFTTQGQIPRIPDVKFYKGFFETTITEYLEVAEDIALLHIDSDLYKSAIEILFGLNEYIVTGTIIVFDEWCYCHNEKYNDHEERAFNEWVEACGRKYEFIEFGNDIEKKIVRIL
jgi:hypothetical protein